MKKEFPEYVVNIFVANGYDRLESVAKIDNQTIDEMIAYTNKTFDSDCLRYACILQLFLNVHVSYHYCNIQP